jgi:hypothetical protein
MPETIVTVCPAGGIVSTLPNRIGTGCVTAGAGQEFPMAVVGWITATVRSVA